MPILHLSANDLVTLGRCVCALVNADIWEASDYSRSRDMFLSLAKRCGFLGTSAASKFLENLPIRKQPAGNNVDSGQAFTLKNQCEGLNSVLIDEGLRTTVILTNSAPPDALVNLVCAEPRQQALREDLIVCLKAQLARPTFVTAWALGYDVVRTWIHNNGARLAAFNTQLAKNPRKGEPVSVVDYHDFYHIGEWRFLEVCRDSQDPALVDFNDKVCRALQHLLDQRNEFAHANDSSATPNEALAYVERMIRVITNPPF